MKRLIALLCIVIPPLAFCEVLLYEQETGKILSHATTIDVHTDAQGRIIDPVSTKTVLIASTTNDMNVTPMYTNINQIVIVAMTPSDNKANFDNWSNAELKAALKVLLNEINILRVKAGLPERTPAQAKAAIKEAL